ncbi:YadA C-terminal domain-containing protein [Erwinia amylovora]
MKATRVKLAVLSVLITFSFVPYSDAETIFGGTGNTITNSNGGITNITGYDNTLDKTFSSTIYGDQNIITSSDVSVVGQGNKITGGTDTKIYGNMTGDYNKINGSGNINVTGSKNTVGGSSANIVGSYSEIDGDKSSVLGNNASVNANSSVSIGDGSTNNRDNTVSVGSAGNERQITSVSAGTHDTDAVNVKQLNDKSTETLNSANSYTDSKITDTKNELNTNITNAKNEAVTTSNNYTNSKITDTKNELNVNVDNSKKEAISTSNNYTDNKYQQGISYSNEKYEQSINYSQNAANRAEQNANNYTDSKLNKLSDYSNQRFKQLDDKINRAEKRLNAGVAGVTAIASIPYVAENNFSYGVGLGNYQNGNAVAAGVQYKTSPNTNVRLNVSWDSSSNTALGVGLAGGW